MAKVIKTKSTVATHLKNSKLAASVSSEFLPYRFHLSLSLSETPFLGKNGGDEEGQWSRTKVQTAGGKRISGEAEAGEAVDVVSNSFFFSRSPSSQNQQDLSRLNSASTLLKVSSLH